MDTHIEDKGACGPEHLLTLWSSGGLYKKDSHCSSLSHAG